MTQHTRKKQLLSTIFSSILFITASTTTVLADEEFTTKNFKKNFSYIIGGQIAQQFKHQGIDIDYDEVFAAMMDVKAQRPSKLTPDQIQATMEKAQQIEQQKLEQQKGAQKGLQEEGEKFLANNAKREEVTVLESGLQYQVLSSATKKDTASPQITDKVSVHYKGSLTNGIVFDNSYDRGQPAIFPLQGVIPGFSEALTKMKVGDKWRVFIPYQLGYGERGAGATIPPYSTLVFELELLKIL